MQRRLERLEGELKLMKNRHSVSSSSKSSRPHASSRRSRSPAERRYERKGHRYRSEERRRPYRSSERSPMRSKIRAVFPNRNHYSYRSRSHSRSVSNSGENTRQRRYYRQSKSRSASKYRESSQTKGTRSHDRLNRSPSVVSVHDRENSIPEEGNVLQLHPPLGDELLNILGTAPSTTPAQGEALHEEIAIRWTGLAMNGLNEAAQKELKEAYSLPSNCALIGAPSLNEELEVSCQPFVKKRDESLALFQAKLATGISALGQGLTDMLKQPDKPSGAIIKALNDSGRTLLDLQHTISVNRRMLFMGTLPQAMKKAVETTTVGKYLFGDDLSQKIKSAKDLDKVGSELKRKESQKKSFSSKGTTKRSSYSTKKESLNSKRPSGQQKKYQSGGPQKKYRKTNYHRN